METKKSLWPGWETVEVLGHGSFGSVYKIQREINGCTEYAALKVISIPKDNREIDALKSDGYDDKSITRYFTDSCKKMEDEYGMMAVLKGHPNVVYCEDIRTVQHDNGFGWDIYIKMELLTPCKTYLSGGVSEEQVIRLGMDICDALILCEERNIVHRDIKPENIFVSRNGSFKLGDFGIAKTMEGTDRGTVAGTYEYMAPEVNNNRPYHTQADIYSLGIVMYWLLNNGATPFLPSNGTKPTASEKRIARERRFAGEKIPAPKNGSKALKAVVLKACAFDPKNRYQSAREMLEDLQRLSGGKKIHVDPGKTVVGPGKKPDDGDETVIIDQDNSGRSGKKNIWPVVTIASCLLVISVLCIVLFSSMKCNHRWVKATCINPQYCEKCGEVIGSTAAHAWIEATSSSPKTCTVCGLTEGSALKVDDAPAPTTAPTEPASTAAAEETTAPNPKHAELEEKMNEANLVDRPESLYDEPIVYTCLSKEGVLMSGHDTKYQRTGGALYGEKLYVYAEESTSHGTWYFVENERGIVGWASFKMKKADPQPTAAAEETTEPDSKRAAIEEKINNTDLAHKPESLYDEPVAYICTIDEGIIRRGHGYDYRQIGGALKGETVYVYAKYGSWYFVENERGKVGWAAFEMVKKDG